MPKEKYKMEDIEYAVKKCILSNVSHLKQTDAALFHNYAYDYMLAVQLDRTRPVELIDEFMSKYGPEGDDVEV